MSERTRPYRPALNGLSKALAYGNGTCLLFSNQLLTMYGVSLKGEPKAILAPPGFRFSGDCDEATAVGGVVDPTTNNNIPEDAGEDESEDESGDLCVVPGQGFVVEEDDEVEEASADASGVLMA